MELKTFLTAFVSSYIGYSIGVFIKYRDIQKLIRKVDFLNEEIQSMSSTIFEMWEWWIDAENKRR